MANLIGRGLCQLSMKYYTKENPQHPLKLQQVERHHQQKLTRITNREGEMCRMVNGKKGGKGYVWTCLICWQYKEKSQNTNWWSSACRVPLRRIGQNRGVSCYDEHISRMDDPVVGCFARDSDHVVLPADYRLYNRMVSLVEVLTLPAFVDTTTMLPTIIQREWQWEK